MTAAVTAACVGAACLATRTPRTLRDDDDDDAASHRAIVVTPCPVPGAGDSSPWPGYAAAAARGKIGSTDSEDNWKKTHGSSWRTASWGSSIEDAETMGGGWTPRSSE